MVTSHPWLVSAIGDVEQKDLRISNHSYRTKQVKFIGISTISASESCHQQLCHIWNPMISFFSYYLIVKSPYLCYLQLICELCCHVLIWLWREILNILVIGIVFFITITVEVAENTEINWCWCVFNHLSCIKSSSFLCFLLTFLEENESNFALSQFQIKLDVLNCQTP